MLAEITPPPQKDMKGISVFGRKSTAWLALCVSLLVTLVAWSYTSSIGKQHGLDRFRYRAERETASVVARLHAYEQVLIGARALFAASDQVSSVEWNTYIGTLNLDHHLPGIQATGYAINLRHADRVAHIEEMRALGLEAYEITPPGARVNYTPIIYIDPPIGRNRVAIGYDMYSNPERREAMDRARDSGEAALSETVRLVQETEQDIQPGFLIYLPVYRNGSAQATLAERRDALQGFVYSAFRTHDLMWGILGENLVDADIELYEGDPATGKRIFDTNPVQRDALYRIDSRIETGGTLWTLRFKSRPEYEAVTGGAEPLFALLGGLLLSLMLFALLYGNAHHLVRMEAATRSLAERRDRYLALVDNVPGVVFQAEPLPPWRFTHVSKTISTLTGVPAQAFLDGEVAYGNFIHPDDLARVTAVVDHALDQHESYDLEYRIRQHDRTVRWVAERGRGVYGSDGKPQWIDGVIIDITERKATENAIRDLAFYDPLTALPNRRLLDDRLRQSMLASERSRQHGAVLFIDLDNFKSINDNFGHDVGDVVLCEAASRLQESVRETDTVARLGGDEFLVMLENMGNTRDNATAKAVHIAEKIRIALDAPYKIAGHAHRCTPSIGITSFFGQSQAAGDLLREADQAMYEAKQAGRNTVRVFRAGAHEGHG